jgi:hypothetical protein
MDVLEGEYAGRKLWERLNIENANQIAVEIAQRSLSAICHAVGVTTLSDSEQLHFRLFIADVRIVPPKGEYPASNVVRGYLPVSSASASVAQPSGPPPASTPMATAPQSAEAARATPPWRHM